MGHDLKFKDITEKIIGASFEVHKFLGNGFQACLPKGQNACRQEVILSTCPCT
jgi:hypothetical protein